MSYRCLNCNYKTKKFSDIKKHIDVKKTCITNLSPGLEYNIDQIIVLALLPYDDNNNHNIDKCKIKDLKYIYDNKKILLNILSDIDKNKIKKCNFCNKTFCKIQELREHILLDCFQKEMSKKEELKINVNTHTNTIFENNVNNSNDTNITQNINSNNINNNINITVNIPPISFDKSWNLSEIDELKKKYDILYSEVMYTTLLEKILENKLNLNVIVDTKQNIGFVYQNEIEKYVKMNLDDIVQKSMEKLHKNLLEINDNINNKAIAFTTLNKFTENRINDKLYNYNTKPEIKKYVDNYMADMFDKKKAEAYDMSKNVENTDNLKNLGY
jgi:hypothetical protein